MKQKIEINRADARFVRDHLTGVLCDLGRMSNADQEFASATKAVSLWRKERRYFLAREIRWRTSPRKQKGARADALRIRDELDRCAATVAQINAQIAA